MPSYLVRRPSGWHFRMRVPQDLQPLLARRELRRSLARHDAVEAARLARHLCCGADRIFRRAVSPDILEFSVRGPDRIGKRELSAGRGTAPPGLLVGRDGCFGREPSVTVRS